MNRISSSIFGRYVPGLNRRQWMQASGVLAALLSSRKGAAKPLPATTSSGLQVGPGIYESIGVHPIINCRGTFTVIGGSLELPEVRAAQDAAAQHYVPLDEMMDGIGKRLAEITGAEWGMVSSGCAAALAHATAACVAGDNPDRHVKIPNLAGFPRDEVIIPVHSRNEYDAAIRSIGVRIVEVEDVAQFEAALGPRVAMVYVLAGPRAESGPLPYDAIFSRARQRNIPVLVDAAAEGLTIPNVHLQRGATLVGYSGGKALRGPQCAGLLLGRKDLVKAAWVHSAPHHGYGRSMKLGKEEAMGMLAAVEMWVKRDHDAEWKQWLSWMNHISESVSPIDGVTTSLREPRGLSNRSPGLSIRWDTDNVGISGEQVAATLFTTEPRIALAGGGGFRGASAGRPTETGVSITAYMMSPGDEKIVGERLRSVLAAAAGKKLAVNSVPPSVDVSGEWDVNIRFAAGSSEHRFALESGQGHVKGIHTGDFVARDLSGTVTGNSVKLTSDTTERHGERLTYTFTGAVDGDGMGGNLDMGEYLSATWTAKRHHFGPRQA